MAAMLLVLKQLTFMCLSASQDACRAAILSSAGQPELIKARENVLLLQTDLQPLAMVDHTNKDTQINYGDTEQGTVGVWVSLSG